jgi:hypothetical protein
VSNVQEKQRSAEGGQKGKKGSQKDQEERRQGRHVECVAKDAIFNVSKYSASH